MPRRWNTEDEWEEDSDLESDEDDEPGSSEDDEEATVPCPYCRRQIHEDSQRCPYCEKYISAEDAPPGPKPRWFVLGFLFCLLIVLIWILRGW
jgi:hypothetical protein